MNGRNATLKTCKALLLGAAVALTGAAPTTALASDPVRLAGVTRWLSMTPARYSAISPKPTNSDPKMPSWTRIPGTKIW